ncbi:hypothetical protein [Mucilaginibacter jinjuensis]|uniref:Uncharacterized protein n=1 Tax=Mucilaginibacter jinjuensis TaxID=1176721 RepID=A0ABY7T718_9SPHI|nr:hypothetical protein [Mucilaginibacter jinjuensis]WCT12285.1 hypothetical protein PQO05_26535 [Mucilaginibacter jinjuensis]
MENDLEFKELSPDDIRNLQLGMRHLFTNYPHEELKKTIWELYRGWVYNSAEYVSPKEITEMLLLYEAMLAFTNDVHEYCQYP